MNDQMEFDLELELEDDHVCPGCGRRGDYRSCRIDECWLEVNS